tara:strand:+ start:154 stop:2679 length:2526 start_codon:yes stop_codon:yes gene_type:complete
MSGQANGDVKPGAIILLSAKGLVQAIDPNGNVVAGTLKPGAVLAEGYSLKTGFGGEAAMLFSNGTVATLEPRSQVKILSFLQKSFDAGNQKLSEVQKEPSSSQIDLDLDTGSLVVQTKKLDRTSSFSIESPVGSADIVGTQFQMGISPVGETKLDVSTSSVSFTPTGGSPILVSQGKGLDVSSTGSVNQRPIDPVISVNISTKNSIASNIAGQIPLTTVNQANEKASALSVMSPGSSDSSYESTDESGGDEDSEDSDSSDASESFIEQQSENFRSVPGAQTGASFLDLILGLANDELTPPSDVPSTTPPSFPSTDFELSASGNSWILKVGTKLNLLDGSSQFIQDQSLNLSGKSVSDILNFLDLYLQQSDYSNELLAVSVSAFYKIQEKQYDNDQINNALRGALDLSKMFLKDVNIGSTTPTTLSYQTLAQGSTDVSPGKVLNASDLVTNFGNNPYLYEVGMILAEYGALGDSSREATNIAIEIFNFLGGSSGQSIPTSFSIGDEKNNQLLSAALLGSSHNDLIDPPSDGKGVEGVSDSFAKKKQADSLYKIYRDNIYGVVGADVTIGSSGSDTDVDVSNILVKAERQLPSGEMVEDGSKKRILAFTAAKDLHIKGDVTFKNDNSAEDHALVLGAGDHVEIEEGASIKYEGSNVGIGSYSSLTLNNVDIDVGGNLAIGSLSDLEIKNNTNFSVGRYSDRDSVYLYAENAINVDGLNFEARPNLLNNRFKAGVAREIYMEAITIDLKNVHFPAESEVMLRSRDGIPKFYGGSYQLENFVPGAVNFYSDSNKYGGNVITSSTFTTSPNGNPDRLRQFQGYDSIGSNFTTSSGTPGVKIRKFPE